MKTAQTGQLRQIVKSNFSGKGLLDEVVDAVQGLLTEAPAAVLLIGHAHDSIRYLAGGRLAHR